VNTGFSSTQSSASSEIVISTCAERSMADSAMVSIRLLRAGSPRREVSDVTVRLRQAAGPTG